MSTSSRCRRLIWIATVAVILFPLCVPSSFAQTFDIALLERARAASKMIPGDNPLEVRFQGFHQWSDQLSQYVDGATDKSVPWVYGVFQIRYQDGWVMVDTGAEAFTDADHVVVGKALAQAKMNVLTHEHNDHAAGLTRGESAEIAARRTLLTVEQLESMLDPKPGRPITKISTEMADRFLVVSYEELLPIAPGVVLIKAPGHSQGSQIVYVDLASGAEILIVGDVVWHKSQIESASQKGSYSDGIGEDRKALQAQIEWLQEVSETDSHVVIAHDLHELEAQIAEGILIDGLYSTN